MQRGASIVTRHVPVDVRRVREHQLNRFRAPVLRCDHERHTALRAVWKVCGGATAQELASQIEVPVSDGAVEKRVAAESRARR
eukprot:1717245-Prymnesium_polylepis.1